MMLHTVPKVWTTSQGFSRKYRHGDAFGTFCASGTKSEPGHMGLAHLLQGRHCSKLLRTLHLLQ
jgi:hypothetical protein